MQLQINIRTCEEMKSEEDVSVSVPVDIAQDHLHFTIGSQSYYALPASEISDSRSGAGFSKRPALVSVIPVKNGETLTTEWLDNYVNRALASDDVTRPEFFSSLLFSGCERSTVAVPDFTFFPLSPWGTTGYDFLSEYALSNYGLEPITPGPYVLMEKGLWRVYRLFDDFAGAFMVSCKPNLTLSAQPFENLRVSGEAYQTISLAVASRLSASLGQPCSKYPLRGKRIAVKDIYQLKGLKTSLCNKAYYDLSPHSSHTAPTIQRLIDAGAQIVGKTKLSSLISREEPTEAVDYQTPFNPRGEGYQSPAGSSSGSAVAIAAYEWLDFAIGSDRDLSLIIPADITEKKKPLAVAEDLH